MGRSGVTEIAEPTADGTLSKDFVSPENIILLSTVGSGAHGLALAGTDDRDEMGIVLEPPQYVIGLDHFEQKITRTKPEGVRSEHGDLDQVIYSARKFCRLALSGNPSILVLLFAPKTTWQKAGEELCTNAHWFACRKAGNAFLGYATQQRQRLTGERGQKNVKRPELVEKYGYDTKYAMHMVRLTLQGREFLQTGRLTLPMKKDERDFLMSIRTGKVDINDLLTLAGELECEVADLIETSPLPEQPDREAVNQWLINTYTEHWG